MNTTTHTNDCVRQRAKFGARSAAGDVCSCGGDLPEIVKRALVETVTSIGQLSTSDLATLNKYVKKGWLSRGKGGPFPMLKTVYACPGFDFAASRARYVEHAMMLSAMDREAAQQRAQPREDGER
jgi:hypothetical protein